jgi:hypothetical protein
VRERFGTIPRSDAKTAETAFLRTGIYGVSAIRRRERPREILSFCSSPFAPLRRADGAPE